MILGWVNNNGSLSASTHRITTLSTYSGPVTVEDMRSFIGAYRFLLHVLLKCAQTLAPLEEAIFGRESREKIDWSAELEHNFHLAQAHLQKSSSITLPQAADQLWIVTDASVKAVGLAATLYVMRHRKHHLSGHFSARLRSHQRTWLPCELEALAIAASVKHFSPHKIQIHKPVCVLTDSMPCVEAAEKLYITWPAHQMHHLTSAAETPHHAQRSIAKFTYSYATNKMPLSSMWRSRMWTE